MYGICPLMDYVMLTSRFSCTAWKPTSLKHYVNQQVILSGYLAVTGRFFVRTQFLCLRDSEWRLFLKYLELLNVDIQRTFVNMKKAWVYFITNRKKSVLYTGMTSDMSGRLQKHVDEHYKGFPSKYGCKYLVYYEEFNSILDAIAREKQLKGWSRAKKDALIKGTNPGWDSLNHKFLA